MGECASAWRTLIGGVVDRAISPYPTVSFFCFEVLSQATTSVARKPRPILVMPGIPNKRTAKVLARLGIELVSFTWDGSRPKFRGLDRATRY